MINPQKGAIGVVITVTVKDENGTVISLATASTKNIMLQKPSGTLLTKAGVFVTDGTDGKIKYTTIAGDLDQAGLWRVQAAVVLPNYDGKSSKGIMIVESNLGE